MVSFDDATKTVMVATQREKESFRIRFRYVWHIGFLFYSFICIWLPLHTYTPIHPFKISDFQTCDFNSPTGASKKSVCASDHSLSLWLYECAVDCNGFVWWLWCDFPYSCVNTKLWFDLMKNGRVKRKEESTVELLRKLQEMNEIWPDWTVLNQTECLNKHLEWSVKRKADVWLTDRVRCNWKKVLYIKNYYRSLAFYFWHFFLLLFYIKKKCARGSKSKLV